MGNAFFRKRFVLAVATALILCLTLALSVTADWDLVAGDSARVAYTGGDGVNLRAEPGYGEVIARLPEDYPVVIQDSLTLDDGSYWYSVSVDLAWGWSTGWVVADYLTDDAAESTFVYEGNEAAADVPAAVSTGGEPLNMRANPWSSADIVTSIPDGGWVDVLAPSVYDDAGMAWSYVRYAGMAGYAASAYLGHASFGGAQTGGGVQLGAIAYVSGTGGDGVNLRDDAWSGGAVLAILPEGAAVDVLDGPYYDAAGEGWYMVTGAFGTGWVHGGYLSMTASAQLASSSSDAGLSLAELASYYIGVPYIWAGVTPNGFDCSGFTYFLINEVLGYDFSRVIEDQMESGYYVSSDELAPGDLIFFQNTYTWGLSHVGIYIGNGQMISASGEHMAVGINDLNDPYWSTRYLTARRVV